MINREGRWESFKSRVNWVLTEIKKGNIEPTLESGTTGLKQYTSQPVQQPQASDTKKYYRVVAGSVTIYSNAKIKLAEIQAKGVTAFIKATQVNGQTYYRIYCGSFGVKANAVNQQNVLKAKGISSFLVYE